MRALAAARPLGRVRPRRATGSASPLIALIELLKAAGADLSVQYFDEARFAHPVGYTNANVGLWMLGLLPCAVLAGRRGVPAPLRGLFLGAAGLLAGAALLGQSRGWLMTLPIVAVLAILVVPGRGRTIAAFAAIGAALLLILDPLLDVYNELQPAGPPGAVFDSALRALLLACAGLTVLGALAAVADQRVQISAARARRISAAAVAAVALATVAVVAGYAIVERNPVSASADAWDEFKQGGYSPTERSTRLSAGFSTYRYDYWRVAWSEFEDAPLLGAGADNFGRAYLRRGREPAAAAIPTQHRDGGPRRDRGGRRAPARRRPRMRAAGRAARPPGRRPGRRRLRRRACSCSGTGSRTGRSTASGSSRRSRARPWPASGSPSRWRAAGTRAPSRRAPSSAAGARSSPLAHAGRCWPISIVPPWLSEREQRRAIDVAPANPDEALERLDRAAKLNPLSPAPYKTAALVEIRRGRYDAAAAELRRAFERDAGDPDLYLLLGLAESERGRPRGR